ncbi:MAG: TonB-dependent receptor [Lysobacterales bacterium]|nr:MAG: TonB-dependent receptor [Xanthomonadales bacterium]
MLGRANMGRALPGLLPVSLLGSLLGLLPGVLLWPLTGLASPAAGDAGENAWDEGRALETVIVTATRIEQSVLDVAEAVTVVGADDIERLAPELLAEMLRGMPGAFFQQTTPGQGIPIIRGLKGSQVLHLVDGMRLNNAFFRDAPNQYLGLVDAYAVERIEVIRGSAPSLYGADAMGGVVQVLTREPVPETEEWSAEGRLYGAWDSADSSLIGRAEASTGRTGSALAGGVTWQDHGNRRIGGGEVVRPSGYRSAAADLKFLQDLGERAELMLSAQYLEQPATPRVDELVPGFGQTTPASAVNEFMPNRREFLHARYRLDGNSPWFSRFEAHLARQIVTDDRLTQDYGDPALTREFNESALDGLTLQFNTPWGAGSSNDVGADSELVWGLEYYADEVSSSRFRHATASGPQIEVAARFPDDSTMDSAAAYASNHWTWERFSLDAGLRYSRFDVFLPATAELAATRLEPDDLTGDVHFGYELTPGVNLVANVGRGFRPPNIFDLGTLGSRPGNRFNVPNRELQPETVWSYDLGLKLSSPRWQAEVFAWYADYRDKIGSQLTGEVTPEGRLVVRSDNLNSAELHGIESGLRFLAAEAVEVYAVLNYTRGEERETQGPATPADRIPPLQGRLGLTWGASERARLEPYFDFATAQDRLSPRDQEDPRIDPQGTPGWGTLNLLLSWQATQQANFGLKLQNLGDKRYREHGSGIDAAGRNLGLWFNLLF